MPPSGPVCHDAGTDRGQSVVLLLPIVAIAAVLAMGAARFGTTATGRAQAQAAADAAALAAVEGGASAASRLARANGGTLTRFAVAGGDVVVTVTVGGVSATARATNGP